MLIFFHSCGNKIAYVFGWKCLDVSLKQTKFFMKWKSTFNFMKKGFLKCNLNDILSSSFNAPKARAIYYIQWIFEICPYIMDSAKGMVNGFESIRACGGNLAELVGLDRHKHLNSTWMNNICKQNSWFHTVWWSTLCNYILQ